MPTTRTEKKGGVTQIYLFRGSTSTNKLRSLIIKFSDAKQFCGETTKCLTRKKTRNACSQCEKGQNNSDDDSRLPVRLKRYSLGYVLLDISSMFPCISDFIESIEL